MNKLVLVILEIVLLMFEIMFYRKGEFTLGLVCNMLIIFISSIVLAIK